MSSEGLAKAIADNRFVVMAEFIPPRSADAAGVRAAAEALKGSVDAICAAESPDGARMCSLSACGHLAAAGAEPVLSLLTRDCNRIALQAAILGARSMGAPNMMLMSGRHQALTSSRTARGVFDLDPIQLIRVADALRKQGRLADGQTIDSPIDFTLGTDTNPFADPTELQVIALDKAVSAGADFVITQPVFNIDRFNVWMTYVRQRGIHERTCIIASVMPITSSQDAVHLAEKYSHLDIPDAVVERLETAQDPMSAGVHLAVETIERVHNVEGVRGVHIMSGENYELAASVLSSSGLTRS
ncbi:MAG: methylenetetrahydrofolate reductase [Armatimonadota bacterium]|nr:methylenetetrahydrofolate reductase [Armatimonadota bacterium]